jgi:hypothetical protein
MPRVLLDVPQDVHAALWRHLLRKYSRVEEAAFVYAGQDIIDGNSVFQYVSWLPVPARGFASRSRFHFELTDEMRGSVIKRAHDLGASLVEFHSHTRPWPASFSPSDLSGFHEFVPHVWWRLKGRPYMAIVVSRSGFDGFAWLTDPRSPQRVDGLLVEGTLLLPTNLSPLQDDENE